jgi:serine/threonine protein kinase/WD40 repeat protein
VNSPHPEDSIVPRTLESAANPPLRPLNGADATASPANTRRVFAPAHAAHALNLALHTRVEETSGAWVGHYKLLQKIGEGGFGVVWMAEQEQPIRRRVAVKIIKVGMDTEEVIARFEAERQALALMEHPNIARVLDAGATDAGRPYFVMELVRGVAITRYCDDNRLPPAARLRLFVTVCHAVQHAHQKGVIHRDLKPSNILVTLHDGVPVPKIIDFGIAKATSAQLTDKTLFTQFHAFIGTPAYTSPEQMEMSGLDVDTRSDIYSLGVLLYELLAGQPPFDSETLMRSGLEAMRRTIREIDPPRPSARLSARHGRHAHGLSNTGVSPASFPPNVPDHGRDARAAPTPNPDPTNPATIAAHRSTTPPQLVALLRGDLDWIALRCLEKDRTRRYDSATALAADLERHLNDEPVEARPPGGIYRTRKFIRRHKLAVGAATAVAASLVAGLIASSTLFVRERTAHNRAALAEKKESDLRHQAEVARADEVKRAARTALDLANRNLADGRVADGLAYLVYAARKDPLNRTLAPRIASAVTSHNFLLPTGAPFECGSRVLAVRFTKDGRSFFVGTEDGTFRVMDAATGTLKREFRLGRKVILGGWEFARDNETIVGARFTDNTFGVYAIEDGLATIAPLQLDPRVWQFPESLGLGHATGLSPDGRWIYAHAHREFWLWDAATGHLHLNPKLTEAIGGSDFSPDGSQFAITVGNSVERWALPEATRLSPPLAFRAAPPLGMAAISNLRFSPDGRRFVVFDFDVGRVFDAVTGTLIRTLPKLNGYLLPSSLVFPNHDRVFGSGSSSSGSWDLENGEFTPLPIPAGDNLLGVAFDASGRRGVAASSDGLTRVFDPGSTTPVAEPGWKQGGDFCATLSPDGSQAIVGAENGMLFRFNVGRGRAQPLVLARSLTPPMPAPFLRESPARLLLLGGDRAKVLEVASGREVAGGFLYPEPIVRPDAPDSKPPIRSDLKFMVVRTLSGQWQSWELGDEGVRRVVILQDAPAESLGVVVFSPSGDLGLIASGYAVRAWDLRTGAPLGPPVRYPSTIVYMSVNFSPDGKRIGLGTADGAALVLDLATARPVARYETRPLVPNHCVLFSPNGAQLVTANARDETRLWNTATGEAITPVVALIGSGGQSLFSADGRWLANWGGNKVTLWDGRTGATVGKTIPAGGKQVRFNREGTRLATAERTGNVQIWDVPSGELVTEPLSQGPHGEFAPEFSPDGRFLRTEAGAFTLWSIPPAPPDGAVAPPEWLLQLATLCATKIVDERGNLTDSLAEFSRADALRREIAALPADAPYAEWGRWILDDRAGRPIAPGFTIAPAEAEKLAAEKP